MHWIVEYTGELLSLTYKVLTTSQASYLNNLISVQPPSSTRSSLVVTLSCPPTVSSLKSQTAHSDMHYPVSGINSLIHSVSLASHVSTHLLIHLSAHLCHHHHSSSISPGSKPTFSTNPSHLNTSTPGLLSRSWNQTYHASRFIVCPMLCLSTRLQVRLLNGFLQLTA